MPRRTSFVLLICLVATSAARAEPPTKPKGLKPGDTIALVAPCGPLNEERMTLAAERLTALGYDVRTPDDLFRRRGYLAGDDQRRADELTSAFADPEVDAVFPGTGGYGATRMLDLVDWDVVAANPKVFIGFSDVTALHLAIAAKCNFITFHTPTPQYGLGSKDGLHPFSERYFWRSLLAAENVSAEDGGAEGFEYELPADAPSPRTLRPGVATGPLIGGNLTLVASLMGTPYEIDTDGRVLFLEDVSEAPYRVDRMLSQLKLGGKLRAPAAVILCRFTYREPDNEEGDGVADEKKKRTQSFDEVFADYFGDAPYPVITDFPMGHGVKGQKWSLNATLPEGALVEVDAGAKRVRLLENPVKPD
ncbi:S66 peptidase family protein [Pseudobythopirellula maris]|nr:LD-carboxypeptidase [Pseudobythopirellula maris]